MFDKEKRKKSFIFCYRLLAYMEGNCNSYEEKMTHKCFPKKSADSTGKQQKKLNLDLHYSESATNCRWCKVPWALPGSTP